MTALQAATLAALLALAPAALAAAPKKAAKPEPARPVRVVVQTEKGEFELELQPARAPRTVANFLAYVDAGLYDGGMFHRAVKPDNQPHNPVKIEVIQGGVQPARESELRPAIPLERTRDTGLKHQDGTVSMARDAPDTAQE